MKDYIKDLGLLVDFIQERINQEETKQNKIYCINQIRNLLIDMEDKINGVVLK